MSDAIPRDAIAVLAAIPDALDAAVREAGAVTLEPAGGDWTPSEIAGHLGDAARYWGARMRRGVHEERPELPLFDENALVALAAYRYRDLDELMQVFRLTSAGNIAFLRGLPPEAWERVGMHVTRGAITVREMVTLEAEHQRGHLRQFRAALGLTS
jgi:hypothetical protein